MGTQIITQPQTLKNSSTVVGAAAGAPVVDGLTVYGNVWASGTIRPTTNVPAVPAMHTGSNGATTSFGINGYTNDVAANYLVSVGGLVQVPTVDYNVSGGNVVFTSAPPTGATVYILAFQW